MRLVDADALKEDCRMANDCKDCKTYVRDCEYDRIYTKMDFCGWLDDAPTVDAVPVVMCRDCEYWDTIPRSTVAPLHHQCKETRLMTTGTWYCPLGKRKDGDDG